jgi:DNA-binding response OmpR family regulator
MRGNILILTEDATFARMLELELKAMHFAVQINAPSAARESDLILVDLDSASIPQKAGSSTRIVGFTRRFEVSQLDAERRCSMILHRPFQMCILREEVALLSSATQEREQHKSVRNPSEISLAGTRLTLGEATMTLRPKEAAVMSALLTNRGKAVSREMLSAHIGESSANKVDVYVCYLRRKIATVTEKAIIKTVRGNGYKII